MLLTSSMGNPNSVVGAFPCKISSIRDDGILKDGLCKFRKTYTLDGRRFEKCNGAVFEFRQPNKEKLPDYMDLLKEFYAGKRRRR